MKKLNPGLWRNKEGWTEVKIIMEVIVLWSNLLGMSLLSRFRRGWRSGKRYMLLLLLKWEVMPRVHCISGLYPRGMLGMSPRWFLGLVWRLPVDDTLVSWVCPIFRYRCRNWWDRTKTSLWWLWRSFLRVSPFSPDSAQSTKLISVPTQYMSKTFNRDTVNPADPT